LSGFQHPRKNNARPTLWHSRTLGPRDARFRRNSEVSGSRNNFLGSEVNLATQTPSWAEAFLDTTLVCPDDGAAAAARSIFGNYF
jgi:hypothetical protein